MHGFLAETQTTRSGPLDRHPDRRDAVKSSTYTYNGTARQGAAKNVPAFRSSPHHGSR
ncbi:hypothetical protein BDU57DRAFT_511363 [Ampelomyces quisqualis]|uniref:Uncharacterized protein n=1 Tax=Ampelomyces quisqualis TaxID=50730 RepID=A0A6A5QTA5_AMPQU|nr:hypothetical protein BDU57DRAFT_511363 [Ampelomyces quisqualis]